MNLAWGREGWLVVEDDLLLVAATISSDSAKSQALAAIARTVALVCDVAQDVSAWGTAVRL